MITLEEYQKYQLELGRLWIQQWLETAETTSNDNGFIVSEDECVCAMYIKPEKRRSGAGKELVKEHLKKYKLKWLRIIKWNEPALAFWNSVFVLKKVDGESTDIDDLYEIIEER